MASGAVLSIEEIEIDDFAWWEHLRVGSVDAQRLRATGELQARYHRSDCESNENGSTIHCR
jgi:hypothetical protein